MIEKPGTVVEYRDPSAPMVYMTQVQLDMPEVKAMLEARETVKRVRESYPDLVEAERAYNEAWDVMVAALQRATGE